MSVTSEPSRSLGNIRHPIHFDDTSQELSGPIIDWCNSLSYPRIKEIRLHRSSGPPISFFVAVLLEDGASYCIKRHKQDARSFTKSNANHDTIERISLRDLNSQRLVTVTFIPEYYPNLISVLTVCHGIQRVPSPLGQIVFSNERPFAYALLCNAVRGTLECKDMADYDETALEALWKEVYRFVYNREYGFREKTIAIQTQSIVHRLLRISTMGRLCNILNIRSESIQSADAAPRLSKITSAMAWVEVSASRHESLQLSQWDQAWSRQWDQSWSEDWGDQWMVIAKREGASLGSIAWGHLGIPITRPDVDGGMSGRSAGRSPVQVQASTVASAPPDSALVAQRISSTHPSSTSKLMGLEVSNKVQIEVTSPESAPHVSSDIRPSSPNKQNNHLLPYAESRPIWTTTCELAAELGWMAAWDYARRQGRMAAQRPRVTKDAKTPKQSRTVSQVDLGGPLQRTTSRLTRPFYGVTEALSTSSLVPKINESRKRLSGFLHGNGSKLEHLSAPTSPVVDQPSQPERPGASPQQNAGPENPAPSKLKFAIEENLITKQRENQRHEREQKAAQSRQRRDRDQRRQDALRFAQTAANLKIYPDKAELSKRVSEAWIRTKDMPNSPEHSLADRAEHEWTRRAATLISPSLMGDAQQAEIMLIWKETFQKSWEMAWKESWEQAWQSSWQYGWREAIAKGIEFGVDEVLSVAEAEDIKSLLTSEAYAAIKTVIDTEATYLGILDRLHSMYKELEQLHSTLQHSIPMSHEHMTIKMAHSKKQLTKLISHLAEGAPEVKVVSHFELQKTIDEESLQWFGKDTGLHGAFTHGMGEVWEYTMQTTIVEQS